MDDRRAACRFNKREKRAGVSCNINNRRCEICGWNPDVAKARLEAFCKKHGISIPVPRVPDGLEE